MRDPDPPPPFRAFPQLNGADLPVRSRKRFGSWVLERFASDRPEDQLARALLAARAVPFKELVESFEFFAHVRHRVRAPVVADLCCGHGLVGLLYGLRHRDVERVLLVDRVEPESAARCLDALAPVAPWLPPKVSFQEGALEDVPLPKGAAVLGIHACGTATDAVLDRALAVRGPVALLPCCHPERAMPGPPTLGRALGIGTATDVHRTYRLHAAGYRTRWSEIPPTVTPMNRVIAGWPEPT